MTLQLLREKYARAQPPASLTLADAIPDRVVQSTDRFAVKGKSLRDPQEGESA